MYRSEERLVYKKLNSATELIQTPRRLPMNLVYIGLDVTSGRSVTA